MSDPFVLDTFTDVPGATFFGHVGEAGANWSRGAGLTGSIAKFDTTGSRIRSNGALSNSYFYSNAPAPGDGSYCEIAYDVGTTVVDSFAAVVRATSSSGYQALMSGNALSVRRLVNSAFSANLTFDGGGTTKTITNTPGSSKTLRIKATGTGASVLVELFVDNVLVGTFTDTDATRVTGLGSVGFTCFGNYSDTTGFFLDKITGKIPEVAATALTLTGPTSLTTGQASAPYTIASNGTLAAPVVVTLSDGGAGGTFNPPTVTLAASSESASSATSVYTAASGGPRTISVTNNGGLSNPAPIPATAVSTPTGTVTSQPAPDGQSQRFVGTATDATGGTYTLTGSDGGETVSSQPFAVTAGAFDFTHAGLVPGAYAPTLTVSGPGGTAAVSGTTAFSIAGVGGGGELPGGGSGSVSTVTGVTVSPAVATGSTPFSAVVAGSNSPSQAVTWERSPAVGSIASNGVFTAPAQTNVVQSITITARSVQDSTKTGTATVTIAALVAPQVATVSSVTVSPSSGALAGGATRQHTATVAGTNSPSQAVTWERSPAVGSISTSGLFTAPAESSVQQVVTITATSVLDPTKSGTAVATIPAAVVALDPTYGAGLLSNYADLQADIKDWLHRKDLTARIPYFIALAEAKINRIGQVQAMEKVATLALQLGAQSVALPAGFMSPIAAWLEQETPAGKLTPRTPESLPVNSQSGTPSFWAIDGSTLAVDCPAAQQHRVILRYRGGFALSNTSPTNSLLLKYPDVYLYGALLQAAPFLRDADSMGLWQGLYSQAVAEMNRTESRARAAAPLRTELAGLLGCR